MTYKGKGTCICKSQFARGLDKNPTVDPEFGACSKFERCYECQSVIDKEKAKKESEKLARERNKKINYQNTNINNNVKYEVSTKTKIISYISIFGGIASIICLVFGGNAIRKSIQNKNNTNSNDDIEKVEKANKIYNYLENKYNKTKNIKVLISNDTDSTNKIKTERYYLFSLDKSQYKIYTEVLTNINSINDNSISVYLTSSYSIYIGDHDKDYADASYNDTKNGDNANLIFLLDYSTEYDLSFNFKSYNNFGGFVSNVSDDNLKNLLSEEFKLNFNYTSNFLKNIDSSYSKIKNL